MDIANTLDSPRSEVTEVRPKKDTLEIQTHDHVPLPDKALDHLREYLGKLWKEEQLTDNLSEKGFRSSADLIDEEISLRLKDTNFELLDNFKSNWANRYFFKYRQIYKGIPLYGSSIIVELNEDSNNKDVDPSRVDKIGNIDVKLSPEKLNQIKNAQKQLDWLKSCIEKSEKNSLNGLDLNPTPYYYYDDKKQSWRIVYITDIRLTESKDISEIQLLSELVDYIVDADNGEIVAMLSRIKTDPMK